MNLPTKEYILEIQTTTECESLIKQLNQEYDFSKTVIIYTEGIDLVVNALVMLEFRLKEILTSEAGVYANECKWAKREPEPVIKLEPRARGRAPRKFRASDTVYDSIFAAAKATGIKLNTLKTYVSRKPDKYQYIDE